MMKHQEYFLIFATVPISEAAVTAQVQSIISEKSLLIRYGASPKIDFDHCGLLVDTEAVCLIFYNSIDVDIVDLILCWELYLLA